MIGLPNGTRIWLAAGITDMRRGFDGLASIVQEQLAADPFAGHVFVFRGRRGDLVKLLWWDGDAARVKVVVASVMQPTAE
jgi:transposase